MRSSSAIILSIVLSLFSVFFNYGYVPIDTGITSQAKAPKRVLYGQASFYNNMFEGKPTASGEIFSQKKYTAACNLLPLGTWLKVTNLKNGKSVKVRTTDRLHTRMRRLIDLSHIAAKKLGFLRDGLTRVKVEILPNGKR